jgi:thymidylate synthase
LCLVSGPKESRLIHLKQDDRTGTGTLSLFAPPSFRFNLKDGALPLLTTKRVFWRGVMEELLWFIKGSTDAHLLKAKGVGIWDGNGSREYLDKVGLGHYREGELGPVYGFQWRHFGAEYKGADADYTGQGVDQLAEVVRKIKESPMDRRIILSAWNPAGAFVLYFPTRVVHTCRRTDLKKMALPPCHMFCQFYVTLPTPPSTKPLLSCLMYQRSADLGLGVPFNIASYALLTHILAQVTGSEANELILQLGDAHVYKDHVEPLKVQLQREPRDFPTLKWKVERTDVDEVTSDDFEVIGYKPHPKIDMVMSV